MELLNSEQNLRIVFNALEGSYALCLLANLIQLANIEREEVLRELCFPSFTVNYFSIMQYIPICDILNESFTQFVVTRMLEACQQYVVAKRSNLTHWHPVLGWFAQTIDTSLQDATPSVKLQLACLWSGRIVTHLIGECY